MLTSFRSLCISSVLLVGILLGSGFGCATGAQPGTGEEGQLVAEVDSIDAPASIGASDTLSIRLLGTVGPNGCYSFDRLKVDRSADRIEITPLVQHEQGDDTMCTMAIVPLDVTYEAEPPFEEGSFTIVVPQSQGANVTKTVEVK